MMKLTLRVFLIAAVIGAIPLCADIVPVGEPVDLGSFSHSFRRIGVGLIDRLEARMLTEGATFTAGGYTGIAVTLQGWERGSTRDDTEAVASGPRASEIDFKLYFSPNRHSTSFKFELVEREGKDISERVTVSWSHLRSEFTCDTSRPVPEPSTVVFGGGWLVGLALLIARRKGLGCTAA